jgi:4-amino-4-deoxy-L-arabinose transferase-like glycosyltransferase
MQESSSRLRLTDFLLIAVYSFVLFGYAGISGRPLTMHEARLPETARQMQHGGHWLLPMSGIRPWLERPPLPHWLVVASMKAFGHADREWIVRLPSAVMGLITVLLIAGISARWFGRTIGLLSGLALATSYEFYQYSGLAEDDIYLGALVALCMAIFICAEFCPKDEDHAVGFFKNRYWKLWAFFILLGLTNLAKGPLLGLAVVGVTVGTYLLWNPGSLRKYLWFWGWLALVVLTLAWPLYAHHRYPDVLANWKYDYLGRVSGTYSDITQRWYYYAPALALAMLPWTPACLIGLLATAGDLFRQKLPTPESPPTRQRALRLVWCWAIAPLILFSIPKGKHHHYLIPFLAPWAILAAFGLVEISKWILSPQGPRFLRDPLAGLYVLGFPGAIAIAWFHDKIPGPPHLTLLLIIFWLVVVGTFFISLQRASARLLLTTILAALLISYSWGETFLAARTDHTLDDTAFLRRAVREIPTNRQLFINANLGPTGNLDFFRMQFYSPPRAILLHNLSYLRDENIHDSEVFVIARAKDADLLRQLGVPVIVDQSAHSHDPPPGWTPAQASFTLFKLTFDPNLKRYPAPAEITNMQAMQRDRTGPWCGPAL